MTTATFFIAYPIARILAVLLFFCLAKLIKELVSKIKHSISKRKEENNEGQ